MSDMTTINLETMPKAFGLIFQNAALGVKRKQANWVIGLYARCGKVLARKEFQPSTPQALRDACIQEFEDSDAEFIIAEMYVPVDTAILLSKVKIAGNHTVITQLSSSKGKHRSAVYDPSRGEWLDAPKCEMSKYSWTQRSEEENGGEISYQ